MYSHGLIPLIDMQALYFCVPFREQLIEYYSNNKNPADAEENLLTCLADLFLQVNYPSVDKYQIISMESSVIVCFDYILFWLLHIIMVTI